MIATDLRFKVIDRQWHIVDGADVSVGGPYATPAAAIKARQQLAEDDVTATAAKVSRKQQARREKAEAGL